MPFYTTQATTTDDINTVVTSPRRLYSFPEKVPIFQRWERWLLSLHKLRQWLDIFVSWIIWSVNRLCVSNHASCLWPFHPQHTPSCLLLHPCTNQGVHSLLIVTPDLLIFEGILYLCSWEHLIFLFLSSCFTVKCTLSRHELYCHLFSGRVGGEKQKTNKKPKTKHF